MSEYRIWFKTQADESPIELPVNPSEVTITYPGNPTNYDVEGLGEIIVPRIPKLATLSFESFFPRERVYQTLNNGEGWYSPEWYVTYFKKLQKSRIPCELVISRGSDTYREFDGGNSFLVNQDYFNTVLNAVILDLSITDKGGEPGDVYYNMTISEYRDASPKRLAELAEEEVDDSGNVLSRKMVLVTDRPPQKGAIVVDSGVEITGEVYERPDQPKISTQEEVRSAWSETKRKANQINRIVSRVLPPSVSSQLHSVFISGLGWVDKGNCRLGEDVGTVNSLKRLVTNSYD